MGARNFMYENRCVVVSNDDYDLGNLPKLGNWINNNRNYPSRLLEKYNDFRFYNIVLTCGYYEGGCIDFIEKSDVYDIEDWLGQSRYYLTKQDFIKECCYEFDLTTYRVNKLCGCVKDFDNDLEVWLENAYAKITEYIKECEIKQCDKIIDQIKAEYGYEEYGCVATFSNGEGVYKKVG